MFAVPVPIDEAALFAFTARWAAIFAGEMLEEGGFDRPEKAVGVG